MQRGVIYLSLEQQQQIYTFLSKLTNVDPHTLEHFAQPSTQSKFTLSKEEAEQILDSLPAPSKETPEVNVLRSHIMNFYQSLK